MEGFLQLGAVLDHPPVDGGVIHMDAPFEHEFFNVTCTQGEGDIQADAHQNNAWREMAPLKLIAIVALLLGSMGRKERPYHKSPQTKTCDRTLMLPGSTTTHENRITRQPYAQLF